MKPIFLLHFLFLCYLNERNRNIKKTFFKKNLDLVPQTWSFSVVKVVPGPGMSFRTVCVHNF